MSQYRHQEVPVAYSYPANEQNKDYSGARVVAPPPIGYPVRDQFPHDQTVSHETKSRGDGFWKGCCAGLRCCWVLGCCF